LLPIRRPVFLKSLDVRLVLLINLKEWMRFQLIQIKMGLLLIATWLILVQNAKMGTTKMTKEIANFVHFLKTFKKENQTLV